MCVFFNHMLYDPINLVDHWKLKCKRIEHFLICGDRLLLRAEGDLQLSLVLELVLLDKFPSFSFFLQRIKTRTLRLNLLLLLDVNVRRIAHLCPVKFIILLKPLVLIQLLKLLSKHFVVGLLVEGKPFDIDHVF